MRRRAGATTAAEERRAGRELAEERGDQEPAAACAVGVGGGPAAGGDQVELRQQPALELGLQGGERVGSGRGFREAPRGGGGGRERPLRPVEPRRQREAAGVLRHQALDVPGEPSARGPVLGARRQRGEAVERDDDGTRRRDLARGDHRPLGAQRLPRGGAVEDHVGGEDDCKPDAGHEPGHPGEGPVGRGGGRRRRFEGHGAGDASRRRLSKG